MMTGCVSNKLSLAIKEATKTMFIYFNFYYLVRTTVQVKCKVMLSCEHRLVFYMKQGLLKFE